MSDTFTPLFSSLAKLGRWRGHPRRRGRRRPSGAHDPSVRVRRGHLPSFAREERR
jgi:hypothetical protein